MGLRLKYGLPYKCIRVSLYFDMQHEHVLKNFDLMTPSPVSGVDGWMGRGLQAKYLVPCCCIYDFL